MKFWQLLMVGCGLALAASPASAEKASVIRIGIINTTSGPIAALAEEQIRGIELAIQQLGGKIGGVPVEVYKEDGRYTPDTGLQAVTKLVERDKVDFLLGNQMSNEVLAYAKPAADPGVFVLSGLAGPSALAGAQCNPRLFVLSWENNTPSEAVGELMTEAGIKRGYFIGQNYVTGREHVAGAKRFFKGDIVGEAYVPIEHMDFAAELAAVQAANPDGMYVFLPGASGIAFVKQFVNSGVKDKVKLFSGSWLADETNFTALGDAALGINEAANWFADLDNPDNRKFVEAFRKEYGRRPVFYAAFQYDAVMLLNQVVAQRGGDISDKKALQAALEHAQVHSVRGTFAFNGNHFPIQDFYSAEVVKSAGMLRHKTVSTVFHDHKDQFYQSCHMPE
ncbi:MAG TPA: ABC transporter substrate-binding protein [Stellaceae bacterium]|nr:ABC transporter substrate-binding protein [Stellaceae bacterium]